MAQHGVKQNHPVLQSGSAIFLEHPGHRRILDAMRRLSRYTVAEFIGPFLFAFVVITLVLIVDFVPDVVKLVIKKKLDAWVILQVFVLNLAWMLALSIPMAVLSGTLMAFGRLASDSEVLAMKASGVSPARILFPVLIVSAFLGVGLIYFNNEVLPDANHKSRQLMSDIRRARPILEIKENVLADQIPGYHLLVRHLDYRTSEISDVMIFDHKTRQTPRTITAKSGRLAFSADGNTLIVDLNDGEIHESDPQTPDKYRRMTFDHQTFYLTGVGSDFEQSESDFRTDREKSSADMREDIKKWRVLVASHDAEISKRVTEAIERLAKPADDLARAQWLAHPPAPHAPISDSMAIGAAINANTRVLGRINQELRGIENQNRLIDTFRLEIHKKYSIPAACIVFVLIGGPLGILARRGGLGVGLGMSLGLFVMYWAFLIGGEDLSDRGFVSPAVAMWSANVLIGAVGLLLLWRVTRDAPLPLPAIPHRVVAWWEKRFSAEQRIARRKALQSRQSSFCPPGLRRLSWYSLRGFLFNLAWAQAAFWFIFIIIDLVERLDKYIDRGLHFGEIVSYYVYYTPYILVLTLPIAMLLATLFVIGFMGRRNELLAMRASGIPIWRLGGPLLGCALIIVMVVMAAGEYVLPWADQRREVWRREKLKGIVDRSGLLLNSLYAQGHQGRVFYFQTFEPKTGVGTNVLVQTFEKGRLIAADEMESLAFENSLWVGRKGRSRVFPASDTAAVPEYLPFMNRVYRDWTERPGDFVARMVSPENMGYGDLYRYIKAKAAVGGETIAERTDFQWKFSYPLINAVIVLFGMPIAVRVRQSGMALNFGIAMAITFNFRVLIEVFREFGHNGDLSPVVSAWAPIGVFFVAGVIMLSRIRN